MSFGYHDSDWVDPDDAPEVRCGDCEEWLECPCGCGWGYCLKTGEWCDEDDKDGCWR